MAVRAYIFLETDIGRAKVVGEAVSRLQFPGAKVLTTDTVTGPYDVIVQLEADDLDLLDKCVGQGLSQVLGVQRTHTSLAIRLA